MRDTLASAGAVVEEDGHDVGFTTFDYGCTYCLPDFVDGKPVRQRIEPRGKWMCCVKCGGSYGEVPVAATAPGDAQPYLDAIDGALLKRAARNGSAAAQEKLSSGVGRTKGPLVADLTGSGSPALAPLSPEANRAAFEAWVQREYPSGLSKGERHIAHDGWDAGLMHGRSTAFVGAQPDAWQMRRYYAGDDAGWGMWKECSAEEAHKWRDRSDIQVRPLYAHPPA